MQPKGFTLDRWQIWFILEKREPATAGSPVPVMTKKTAAPLAWVICSGLSNYLCRSDYTMKENRGQGRTRNFAAVVYPDSAPPFWQGILAEQAIPAFISPLHNKDVNPTGEPKKPHYHIMLMFDGVKSLDQVKEIFNKINAIGCEKVNSVRGYARYLVHADNPEKAQYSVNDVISLGGADYNAVTMLQSDYNALVDEMIMFVEDSNIVSFRELYLYALSNRKDWADVMKNGYTLFLKEYLKSKKWDNDEEKRKNDLRRP